MRGTITWVLAFLAIALAVLFQFYGKRIWFGAAPGGHCSSDDGCKGLHARCVKDPRATPPAQYCTRSCDTDKDCPKDWSCERTLEGHQLCQAPEEALK